MKKLVLSTVVFLLGFVAIAQEDEYSKMPYIYGDVLIMVDHNENIQDVVESHRNVNGVMTELTLVKAASEPANIWLLHFNHNAISHASMINDLYTDERVVIAQNNHIVTERVTTPNDPQWGSLWYHNDGASDNDIDSDLAWDITTGGQTANGDDIVVCVIEGSGAQWQHQDLIANHWTNTIEAGGTNGVDDDGNGYMDDVDGWNSGNNTDNIGTGGHGTGVSSMIGAVGNNGTNVVGANWNVKIMQVDMAGSLTESNVIAAYTYPLVMRKLYTNSGGTSGAFVVATNASWGIDGGDPANAPLWCAFYDTLGVHGILNMGATANQNWDIDAVGDLPTACGSDYMISVTATNNNDVRTFSGYGQTTIDLGAPGENVLMAYGSGTTGTSSNNGTSFASPLTAGVAALIYSVACSNLADMAMNDPQAAADIVRQALLDGVDPVPNLATETVTGGRLNAFNSCQIIVSDCSSYNTNCTGAFSGSAVDVTGCQGGSNGQITMSSSGGSGSYQYSIDGGSNWQSSATFSSLAAGTYNIMVDDGVDCQQTIPVTVSEPDAVGGSETVTHLSCNGANDGQITMTATGGTAPFTYSIDGGSTYQSSNTFTGLMSGIFNVYYQDANGCIFNGGNVGLNEPSALSVTSTVTNEMLGNDGAIDLNVSGGTPPYSYSWTGPNSFSSTVQDPSGLEPGTYTVTITDANGCVISSGNIDVDSQLSINESNIEFTVYPNPADDELIISLPSSAKMNMQIIDNAGRVVKNMNLLNASTTVDIHKLAAGVYLLKLTDSEGNIATTKLVIK